MWWWGWTIGRYLVLQITGLKFCGDTELLDAFITLCSAGAQWSPFEKICICSDRPTALTVDQDGRLHNETGPAIAYGDGFQLYYWHGTNVPREWIEDKATLEPQMALTWRNVEQRRAAVEIIGWGKILGALHPIIVDADPNPQIGMLLRCDLPDAPKQQFLTVLCGTGREFVLPVPPDVRTARAANAWTYGLNESDYQLEART